MTEAVALVSRDEVVQIDRLSDDQRELLQTYLRGADIPFERIAKHFEATVEKTRQRSAQA